MSKPQYNQIKTFLKRFVLAGYTLYIYNISHNSRILETTLIKTMVFGGI